ncbi:MAG: hypothetical protein ACPGN3_10810 [Opitutales bacterium]
MRAALLFLLVIAGVIGYIVGYRHYDRNTLIEFTENVESLCFSRVDDHIQMANYISEYNQGREIPYIRAERLFETLRDGHDAASLALAGIEYPKRNGASEYEESVRAMMIEEAELVRLYGRLFEEEGGIGKDRNVGYRISEVSDRFSEEMAAVAEAQTSMLRWNRAIN